MKTRKLASLGLAAVMSLSLAAPVFAEDPVETPPANQTVLTATYTKPDIKVTVDQTAAVALNPLGLDVDLSTAGDFADPTTVVKGQQIITNPAFVTNNSKMKLSVSASVATKLEGKDTTSAPKLTLSQQALLGDGDKVLAKTDKSAFVFFEMATTELTADSDDDAKIKAVAAWDYDYTETVNENVVTPKDGCLILSGTKVVTGSDLVTLAAADDNGATAGGIAMMRLSGKMVKLPKIEWAEDDKITTTVTFTFLPAADEEVTG